MELSLAAGQPSARGTVAQADASDRIISLGIALTLTVVIAQTVAQCVDFGILGLRVQALDSNHHASIFGIASLAAQAALVPAAGARGALGARGTRSARALWLLLAGLVGILLVVRVFLTFNGPALVVPAGIIFVLLWMLTLRESARVRALVRAGLALLVFSFLLHVVGPPILRALHENGNTWPDQVKGMLMHSAELAGWALIATGVLAAAHAAGRQGKLEDGPDQRSNERTAAPI